MLLSGDERFIVSYGNPDLKGAIWYCDTETEQARFVQLSDFHTSVSGGRRRDLFCLHESAMQGSFTLSLRPFDRPTEVLATIRYVPNHWSFEGDQVLWPELPRYIRYADNEIMVIVPEQQTGHRLGFAWFDFTYDHDYQAICGVTQVPGQDLFIVSIARDSGPVVCDPITGQAIQTLSLADRHGNPKFRFRRNVPELWADDYDTLLRLDSTNYRILDSLRIQPGLTYEEMWNGQPPSSTHTTREWSRAFIGDWCFNASESLCAVARPYSYDVVLLDTATFKVTHRAAVPRPPMRPRLPSMPNLERGADHVALLSDGRAFVRSIHAEEVTVVQEWEPYSLE